MNEIDGSLWLQLQYEELDSSGYHLAFLISISS